MTLEARAKKVGPDQCLALLAIREGGGMIFNVMEAVTVGLTSCFLAGLLRSKLHICQQQILEYATSPLNSCMASHVSTLVYPCRLSALLAQRAIPKTRGVPADKTSEFLFFISISKYTFFQLSRGNSCPRVQALVLREEKRGVESPLL